ncbi:hypothetical protein PM082_014462 [Marasmius tenuissimus]|nr:hypothetical protein PM082_014462 [Marasmius tenuissimus]
MSETGKVSQSASLMAWLPRSTTTCIATWSPLFPSVKLAKQTTVNIQPLTLPKNRMEHDRLPNSRRDTRDSLVVYSNSNTFGIITRRRIDDQDEYGIPTRTNSWVSELQHNSEPLDGRYVNLFVVLETEDWNILHW